jgi:hypothetical protein
VNQTHAPDSVTTGLPRAVRGGTGGAVAGLAMCHTEPMRKQLPPAFLELRPVEKILWLYINAHPGQYSSEELGRLLGVYAGRALPALVAAGMLVQEEPPTNREGGRYRTTPAPALKEKTG